MYKNVRLHFLLMFFLTISFVIKTSGQSANSNDVYTFMFYNVENLFDCDDDSLTNDDEFTSTGLRAWNWGRFNKKIDNISKVIISAGKWNAPVIIGLCEIENRLVLEKLISNTSLRNLGYSIVHKDSPDQRGIDVALLYRGEFFKPFDFDLLKVSDLSDKSFKTRDILHVSGILNKCDTIEIFVNHWPSRYGGVAETIKYRQLAAQNLKIRIDDLLSKNINSKIVVMGDFNDSPNDKSLKSVLRAKVTDDSEVKGELINLSIEWLKNPVLTLKNQYSWELFDQLIVSDGFLAKSDCFKLLGSEIYRPDFLFETDYKFGGVKLKRTYNGYKYQEGFSDHLPILLKLHLY